MYTPYWLYELYEVHPEFEDIGHCRRRFGSFEEVCEGTTADIFT